MCITLGYRSEHRVKDSDGISDIREENRRKLIEELGSKVMQKVENEVKQKL